MTDDYETVSDTLTGGDDDGGRVTGKQLALWLAQHRDNDVEVVIHNTQVPVGRAHYCPNSDAILLHLLDGVDLRIATAFCSAGSSELVDALDQLTRRWKAERPDARGHLDPDLGTLLLWVLS